MPQGFRFEPATVRHDRVVVRPRITKLLNERFTHRLTTIVAAAGYGKTTALALAIDNNRLDPLGNDIWLTITSPELGDQELASGIARALGAEPDNDVAETLTRISDAVWSAAPDDVVVIIDDVHLLDGEPLATLAALLDSLPTNGHLVLASRERIELPVARLRAHGHLLEVGVDELCLDDDELDALARRDGTTGRDLPRHVATADLQLAAGIDASADFLWEEVLSALDADRLAFLRRCAVLDDLDDELIQALTDNEFDSSTLLNGLPLVERFESGRRMHSILREALTKHLEPGERRKTLSIAAEAEAARGNYERAVHLHHQADDPIGALDAARSFAIAPTLAQSVGAVIAIRRIVDRIDPDAAVGRLLDAFTHLDGLEQQLGRRLSDAARAARAAGDTELEAVALYRAAQTQLLHHDEDYWQSHHRIHELAEVDEFAGVVHRYLSSILAQLDGRPAEALAYLDDLGAFGRAAELTVRAQRLFDLGRPEEVAVGLTSDDLVMLQPGARAFIALSIWVRGDSSPERSLQAVTGSIDIATRARIRHSLVSTLGTGVLIALAAGQVAIARRWASQARDAAQSVGVAIAETELIARAALISFTESDDAAADLLMAEADRYEFYHGDDRKWPARAHLPSLALVYLCRPDLRKMFDECDLGVSLRTSRQAGQALVALRSNDPAHDAVELASTLPWHRPNLLRANVLPHHLVELACAAIAADHEEAREFLDIVPHSFASLERVSTGPASAAASAATELLGSIPRAEPFRLRALTLGPVALLRDGIDNTAAGLRRRPKMRELFALLVERRSLQRQEICELLWPDHDDEDRALASLRTALSSLHDILEPTRLRGTNAFHLAVVGDTITLDSRITTDLDEFEEAIAAAQADDHSGLPARALDNYRRAIELYRGEYLQGIDAPWVVLTRLRLQTVAVGALCRIAELTAAKGEPESAARWSAQARTIDPLNERAGRIFIAALLAAGDRVAARTAAADLVESLDAADLPLTPATARLIEQLR